MTAARAERAIECARIEGTLESWKRAARGLIARRVEPHRVAFEDTRDAQATLFGAQKAGTEPRGEESLAMRVPRAFIEQARLVAHHIETDRWALLYRLLWRIHAGERRLLDDPGVADVVDLRARAAAVRRDAHKMKAFVRFRATRDARGRARYVAWFVPEHHTLEMVAPFFADRFGTMEWSILTPRISAHWDRDALRFGPGASADDAPFGDDAEDLWRTYYAHIFNPARLNLKAMRAEMPKKFWPRLPEANLIPDLVQRTPELVEQMIANAPPSAKSALPAPNASLDELKRACAACQICDQCGRAERAVFGEGSATARLVLVGEQPGEVEDRAGRPFVGPAGRVLQRAMERVGIKRDEVYLTNAVKHFHFAQGSSGRIVHKSPDAYRVEVCKPWLERELEQIRPALVVCLGRTSATSLLGRRIAIKKERGRVHASRFAEQGVLVTYHPSAALRQRDARARHEIEEALAADLAIASELVRA